MVLLVRDLACRLTYNHDAESTRSPSPAVVRLTCFILNSVSQRNYGGQAVLVVVLPPRRMCPPSLADDTLGPIDSCADQGDESAPAGYVQFAVNRLELLLHRHGALA